MLAHPWFNQDFIAGDASSKDPYAASRTATESRVITQIKYGAPGERIVSGEKKLPPELQKLISDSAIAIAKEMLTGMVEVALKSIIADHEKSKPKSVGKKRGRPGRKPSVTNLVPEKLEPEVEVSSIDAPVAPLGENSASNV